MSRLRRPSPALVISIVALFVALGGGAYAAKKIGTKQLKNKAVSEKKIKDGAVTAPKIADGAVTTPKIAAGAVTGEKLPDGVIGRGKLEASQQTAWALIDGSSNAILAQSGGISIAQGSGGGSYFVKFGFPLTGHAITVTLQAAQAGEVAAGICGLPAPSTPTEQLFCNTTSQSDNTSSTARIETNSSAGVATAKNFYVAVLPK